MSKIDWYIIVIMFQCFFGFLVGVGTNWYVITFSVILIMNSFLYFKRELNKSKDEV